MGEGGTQKGLDWTGQTVLVTGATGFIGRHLVRRLAFLDCDPVLLVRDAAGLGGSCRVVTGDLSAPQEIARLARDVGPDVVFHLGGLTTPMRDLSLANEAVAVNFEATRALAETSAEIGCQSFVFASTSEVYGIQPAPFSEDAPVQPVSPYSASKAMAEQWLLMLHRSFHFPVVITRPFLSYGPGQTPPKLVPSAILAALDGQDFPMTEGTQRRELTFVEDLVEGLLLAALVPQAQGEILNLGEGSDIAIRKIVEMIYDLIGQGGAPLFGAIEGRPSEMMRFAADTRKTKCLLGWQPRTPLEEGLAKTIAWARTHGTKPIPLGDP